MPPEHTPRRIAAASRTDHRRGDRGPAATGGLSAASTTGHRGRHGLSHDYHPIDLETGRPVTASEVERRLNGHFDRLDEIARDAGLSAHAQQKLAKARRVLDGLQATIAFFWATVLSRLSSWQLSAEMATRLCDELLPAVYLEQVAAKARTSAERQRLRARGRRKSWPVPARPTACGPR